MADFQSRLSDYETRHIKIIAISADSLVNATKTVEKLRLTYPVGYGLDAHAFASMTGAFFDEANGFTHATGFILRPDNRIDEAVYSTGPIGRITAADALSMIDYRSKKFS